MRKFGLLLFIVLLLTNIGLSQEQSVVKIIGPADSNGSSSTGSGVIVYKESSENDCIGLIATAKHILENEQKELVTSSVFKIIYHDGTITERAVYANSDTNLDLALLSFRCPKHISAIKIGQTSIINSIDENYKRNNIEAKFIGYAFGKFRENLGQTCFKDNGIIKCDGVVSPGQSGGGMFINGELFGIVSGGHQWHNQKKIVVTWPIICVDAEYIRNLIVKAIKK